MCCMCLLLVKVPSRFHGALVLGDSSHTREARCTRVGGDSGADEGRFAGAEAEGRGPTGREEASLFTGGRLLKDAKPLKETTWIRQLKGRSLGGLLNPRIPKNVEPSTFNPQP